MNSPELIRAVNVLRKYFESGVGENVSLEQANSMIAIQCAKIILELCKDIPHDTI